MDDNNRYKAFIYAGPKVITEYSSNCVSQLIAKSIVYIEESFPNAHCKIWDMPKQLVVQEVKRSCID